MRKYYIGVLGCSKCDKDIEELAYLVGMYVAKSGSYLVCGGLTGVMKFASWGAKDFSGTTIGILPGVEKKLANKYIDIVIPTGIGEARNMIIIRTSDILIAIGGGYGTLSEISFALKAGKKVIGLNTWDFEGLDVIKAKDAKDAVDLALSFKEKIIYGY